MGRDRQMCWLAAGAALWLLAASAQATRPLMDRVQYAGLHGEILPEACCWMPLPPSQALAEARLAQQCSALGGPVGRFALEDGQLWLQGLHTCGGELALSTIYPQMDGPVRADWVSGQFTLDLGPGCQGDDGLPQPSQRWRVQLAQGRVTAMEAVALEPACPAP